jgi:UDPglucose 6-dehydrogenase
MRITVVGAGHVGLVTALGFAELGHQVVAVENDRRKLNQIQRGVPPFHERLLPELLKRHVGRKVRLTQSIADGMREAEAVFICVGTASAESVGTDLSAVLDVVRSLAEHIRKRVVIVEKSTVPVGTCDRLRSVLVKKGVHPDLFTIACNPEFLREGTAVKDFLDPDRIILGADDAFGHEVLRLVYGPMTGRGSRPALVDMSTRSAELVKHAANAFLAMKISFINAVANITEASGADVDEIAAGLGADPRIGSEFLRPGIGYGGACFPKDVDEFRRISERTGFCFDLLNEVQRINISQRQRFLDKLEHQLGGLSGRKLAVLGLSFKGGTDDVRCSPALAIVKRLLRSGARISAYDPAAMQNARRELGDSGIHYCESAYECMPGADALLILTDWPRFARLDLNEVRRLLVNPLVADGRNLYRPEEMQAAGLTYLSVGRAATAPANHAASTEPAVITSATAEPAPPSTFASNYEPDFLHRAGD